MRVEFKLPDLGENIDSGDVVKLLVKVGDTVNPDQPVMELETGKAVVEVPADTAGRVAEILVAEGDKVLVGQPVLRLETDAQADLAPQPEQAAGQPAPAAPAEPPVEMRGDGQPAGATAPAAATPVFEPRPAAAPQFAPAAPPPRGPAEIPAAPNARRMAREMGVDLTRVRGSGPEGWITEDDVRTAARPAAPPSAAPVFTSQPAPQPGIPGMHMPLPDFARWGNIERKSMSSVRYTTAQHMSHAWTTIPQVTQYDRADITELDVLRRRYAANVEAAGGKLTVTAVLLKVVASALRQFPHFNASVDMQAREIIQKEYVNVGVAVNTERGLLVPVIRDADQKNILELAVELARASERAHNRELKPVDLEGGTFSITNLGTIGGTHFTPIVNWPEVAILGISRAAREPVWREEQFEPRLVLPLSLSYDHRVIDGADGARFLRWICEALEQPFFLALEG